MMMFITPKHYTHTAQSLPTPSRSCQPGAAVRFCILWQPGRPMAHMQSYARAGGLLPSHYNGGLFD